ncbi:hypothetical protein KIPB_006057 [Kipferlia bialata]|uniref:Peptidase S59 domain-containing protein n=1 Tax=Kipferlia bialata TaxID=797122 RepID=A0A9K3CY32_9EUKA|nr:hypothetical protein KIPB_006057 [Kipferlia bialata]|eukprot:g6057.t1
MSWGAAPTAGGFGFGGAPAAAAPAATSWGTPAAAAPAAPAFGAAPAATGWGAAAAAPAATGWGAAAKPAAPAAPAWGAAPAAAAPATTAWGAKPAAPAATGWGAAAAAPAATTSAWGAKPAAPATSAWGATPAAAPATTGWGATAAAPATTTPAWGATPAAAPATSAWGAKPAAAAAPAWGAAAPAAAAPATTGWGATAAAPATTAPAWGATTTAAAPATSAWGAKPAATAAPAWGATAAAPAAAPATTGWGATAAAPAATAWGAKPAAPAAAPAWGAAPAAAPAATAWGAKPAAAAPAWGAAPAAAAAPAWGAAAAAPAAAPPQPRTTVVNVVPTATADSGYQKPTIAASLLSPFKASTLTSAQIAETLSNRERQSAASLLLSLSSASPAMRASAVGSSSLAATQVSVAQSMQSPLSRSLLVAGNRSPATPLSAKPSFSIKVMQGNDFEDDEEAEQERERASLRPESLRTRTSTLTSSTPTVVSASPAVPASPEALRSPVNVSQLRTTEVETERTISSAAPRLDNPDMYTVPALSDLEVMSDDELAAVRGFTVGHTAFGRVEFLGLTDVRGLDLGALVAFEQRSLEVYPAGTAKPPVGSGLNRPAIVTLCNVFVLGKDGNPSKKPAHIEKYTTRVVSATKKMGASFISFDPELGDWVFSVQHFSKYGLSDDGEAVWDSETDEAGDSETEEATQTGRERERDGHALSVLLSQHTNRVINPVNVGTPGTPFEGDSETELGETPGNWNATPSLASSHVRNLRLPASASRIMLTHNLRAGVDEREREREEEEAALAEAERERERLEEMERETAVDMSFLTWKQDVPLPLPPPAAVPSVPLPPVSDVDSYCRALMRRPGAVAPAQGGVMFCAECAPATTHCAAGPVATPPAGMVGVHVPVIGNWPEYSGEADAVAAALLKHLSPNVPSSPSSSPLAPGTGPTTGLTAHPSAPISVALPTSRVPAFLKEIIVAGGGIGRLAELLAAVFTPDFDPEDPTGIDEEHAYIPPESDSDTHPVVKHALLLYLQKYAQPMQWEGEGSRVEGLVGVFDSLCSGKIEDTVAMLVPTHPMLAMALAQLGGDGRAVTQLALSHHVARGPLLPDQAHRSPVDELLNCLQGDLSLPFSCCVDWRRALAISLLLGDGNGEFPVLRGISQLHSYYGDAETETGREAAMRRASTRTFTSDVLSLPTATPPLAPTSPVDSTLSDLEFSILALYCDHSLPASSVLDPARGGHRNSGLYAWLAGVVMSAAGVPIPPSLLDSLCGHAAEALSMAGRWDVAPLALMLAPSLSPAVPLDEEESDVEEDPLKDWVDASREWEQEAAAAAAAKHCLHSWAQRFAGREHFLERGNRPSSDVVLNLLGLDTEAVEEVRETHLQASYLAPVPVCTVPKRDILAQAVSATEVDRPVLPQCVAETEGGRDLTTECDPELVLLAQDPASFNDALNALLIS